MRRFSIKAMVSVAGLVLLAAATANAEGGKADHGKIMGCYWGAWSFYRGDTGKFDVEDFDASLCTHGFYGFAVLNNVTWEIRSYDPWYDLAPEDCEPYQCNFNSFRRFTNLTKDNPNFVPMLSVGGWNYGSGQFSTMAADPAKRSKFVNSVVPFLKKFGFQGMDFDWEYPGSREGANADIDKKNFVILVQELGKVLHDNNMIFTAALSPGKPTIDVAYDVPAISAVFDFMNIMTYDYHGWFPDHNFTGVNAPLYGRQEENHPGHPGYYFNIYDTINYYEQLGAPREKMTLGIPFYGRGFVLDDTSKTGLYCPAHAGIPKGLYTRQDGFWGYQEIEAALHGNPLAQLPADTGHWTTVVDDCYKAPYAFNGPYWIGYDDVDSVALKTQYANFLNIAGAFVWSVDTDSFRGDYGHPTFPLLRTVNNELGNGKKMDPSNPKCKGTAPMCHTFDPTTTSTTTSTTTTTTTPAPTTTTKKPSPGPLHCDGEHEVNAYPGDCHKYYRCLDMDGDGILDVTVYNCGDDVFDPNVLSCVDPGLPGNKLICQ